MYTYMYVFVNVNTCIKYQIVNKKNINLIKMILLNSGNLCKLLFVWTEVKKKMIYTT